MDIGFVTIKMPFARQDLVTNVTLQVVVDFLDR